MPEERVPGRRNGFRHAPIAGARPTAHRPRRQPEAGREERLERGWHPGRPGWHCPGSSTTSPMTDPPRRASSRAPKAASRSALGSEPPSRDAPRADGPPTPGAVPASDGAGDHRRDSLRTIVRPRRRRGPRHEGWPPTSVCPLPRGGTASPTHSPAPRPHGRMGRGRPGRACSGHPDGPGTRPPPGRSTDRSSGTGSDEPGSGTAPDPAQTRTGQASPGAAAPPQPTGTPPSKKRPCIFWPAKANCPGVGRVPPSPGVKSRTRPQRSEARGVTP